MVAVIHVHHPPLHSALDRSAKNLNRPALGL